MEPLLIYPENKGQPKMIKAFLKALKVQFEPQSITLPPHVVTGIQESIKQYGNGETISWDEFKDKHFINKRVSR